MRICDIDEHEYKNDRIIYVMTQSEITVSEIDPFDYVPTSSYQMFVAHVFIYVVNEMFMIETRLDDDCIH